MLRIKNPHTLYLFELGTDKGRIEVEANSRTQAAAIARKAGYVVNDVNRTG